MAHIIEKQIIRDAITIDIQRNAGNIDRQAQTNMYMFLFEREDESVTLNKHESVYMNLLRRLMDENKSVELINKLYNHMKEYDVWRDNHKLICKFIKKKTKNDVMFILFDYEEYTNLEWIPAENSQDCISQLYKTFTNEQVINLEIKNKKVISMKKTDRIPMAFGSAFPKKLYSIYFKINNGSASIYYTRESNRDAHYNWLLKKGVRENNE